jgi:hypothetical protein
MWANWTSQEGLQSELAPTSSSTVPPAGLGMTAASAGRETDSSRPRPSNEVATSAPVFPALKSASTLPSLCSWASTPSEEPLLRRAALAAFSDISMRSAACTTSTGRLDCARAWRSAARISGSSPTRVTRKRPGISRWASTTPSTTA